MTIYTYILVLRYVGHSSLLKLHVHAEQLEKLHLNFVDSEGDD
jgi:hypothetical protein